MSTVREHWNAFWRSGPDNLYTFLWWGVFGTLVAAVAWILSHVLPATSLVAMFLAKWQGEFIGAFMAYGFMIVCILGVQVTRRMSERAKEEAASPTVRVTLPITIDLPRGFATKQRVKWDRVTLWVTIFTTMAALAFYGGLVKTSILLLLFALWVLSAALRLWWRNKNGNSN